MKLPFIAFLTALVLTFLQCLDHNHIDHYDHREVALKYAEAYLTKNTELYYKVSTVAAGNLFSKDVDFLKAHKDDDRDRPVPKLKIVHDVVAHRIAWVAIVEEKRPSDTLSIRLEKRDGRWLFHLFDDDKRPF